MWDIQNTKAVKTVVSELAELLASLISHRLKPLSFTLTGCSYKSLGKRKTQRLKTVRYKRLVRL